MALLEVNFALIAIMDEAGKKILEKKKNKKKIGDMPEKPQGREKHNENRGNAKTKMSPLINSLWCFFFSVTRGAEEEFKRMRQ